MKKLNVIPIVLTISLMLPAFCAEKQGGTSWYSWIKSKLPMLVGSSLVGSYLSYKLGYNKYTGAMCGAIVATVGPSIARYLVESCSPYLEEWADECGYESNIAEYYERVMRTQIAQARRYIEGQSQILQWGPPGDRIPERPSYGSSDGPIWDQFYANVGTLSNEESFVKGLMYNTLLVKRCKTKVKRFTDAFANLRTTMVDLLDAVLQRSNNEKFKIDLYEAIVRYLSSKSIEEKEKFLNQNKSDFNEALGGSPFNREILIQALRDFLEMPYLT